MPQAPTLDRSLLRSIPKVDRLLQGKALAAVLKSYPRPPLLEELRGVLDELRDAGVRGLLREEELTEEAIAARLEERLHQRLQPYYRRVINATGILLHTGLGRACLAPSVAQKLAETMPFPQRVEISLETGQRGGRDKGCARILEELIGAEAATVVNNNAGATTLILAALARGKEVLLSRGEMVEIGGSFRIPEIMEESGARLVDVGTTNRTHPKDYLNAITPETGMILKVHTSNYRVVGFTEEVGIGELAEIGQQHGIPVVHDLGSGCLVDLASRGYRGEDWVRDSITAGADLVCFSGDKLLGGPQAGLIAGKKESVDRCRKHPLMRSLRPGRLIYTALEETLRLYLHEEEEVYRQLPTLRRLTADLDGLKKRARRWARRFDDVPDIACRAVECRSQAGSGSLPARDFPSWGIALEPHQGNAASWAAALRIGEPSVLARIQDETLLFDLRTLDEKEAAAVLGRLHRIRERREWEGLGDG